MLADLVIYLCTSEDSKAYGDDLFLSEYHDVILWRIIGGRIRQRYKDSKGRTDADSQNCPHKATGTPN